MSGRKRPKPKPKVETDPNDTFKQLAHDALELLEEWDRGWWEGKAHYRADPDLKHLDKRFELICEALTENKPAEAKAKT